MYYKIKGFENYGINRDGVVCNTDNGVIAGIGLFPLKLIGVLLTLGLRIVHNTPP